MKTEELERLLNIYSRALELSLMGDKELGRTYILKACEDLGVELPPISCEARRVYE